MYYFENFLFFFHYKKKEVNYTKHVYIEAINIRSKRELNVDERCISEKKLLLHLKTKK